MEASHLDYLVVSGVEVNPTRGSDKEFVAIVDSERRWWGTWCYFCVSEGVVGRVIWGHSGSAYVHDIRAFRDPRFPGVLVHTWNSSHCGNGSYQLFHVVGDRVELLVETLGVDVESHGDGLVLHRKNLFAEMDDCDRDGYDDLVLSGLQIQIEQPSWGVDDVDRDWSPMKPQSIRKVFLWRPKKAAFERAHWLDIGSFD